LYWSFITTLNAADGDIVLGFLKLGRENEKIGGVNPLDCVMLVVFLNKNTL
jgi:hypothetical protein